MINRLFGGGKTKSPQATNLQTQKTKQIESLRKSKLSVVETIRDVEYRISVLSGTTNITLIIHLPAQFPQERPMVTVHPPLQHPWVDIQMKVTGCANINNFSMHSDLGVAMQAIVDEFRRTPPRMMPHLANTQYGGVPPPIHQSLKPGYPLFGTTQPHSEPPPLPPRSRDTALLSDAEAAASSPIYPIPDIATAFPDLKDKKLFDLHDLVDNEEKVHELLESLPELSAFSRDRENLSLQCVQLARENLAKKPEVDELKAVLLEKMAELDQLKDEFEKNCERHLVLSDQFHPTNIQTNLKVAVMEAEEESEKVADDFLDKKIDIDEFLQTYMQKRTLCHLRKAKEEKLNQIIMASGSSY